MLTPAGVHGGRAARAGPATVAPPCEPWGGLLPGLTTDGGELGSPGLRKKPGSPWIPFAANLVVWANSLLFPVPVVEAPPIDPPTPPAWLRLRQKAPLKTMVAVYAKDNPSRRSNT